MLIDDAGHDLSTSGMVDTLVAATDRADAGLSLISLTCVPIIMSWRSDVAMGSQRR